MRRRGAASNIWSAVTLPDPCCLLWSKGGSYTLVIALDVMHRKFAVVADALTLRCWRLLLCVQVSGGVHSALAGQHGAPAAGLPLHGSGRYFADTVRSCCAGVIHSKMFQRDCESSSITAFDETEARARNAGGSVSATQTRIILSVWSESLEPTCIERLSADVMCLAPHCARAQVPDELYFGTLVCHPQRRREGLVVSSRQVSQPHCSTPSFY
jgi:hypothetical protein